MLPVSRKPVRRLALSNLRRLVVLLWACRSVALAGAAASPSPLPRPAPVPTATAAPAPPAPPALVGSDAKPNQKFLEEVQAQLLGLDEAARPAYFKALAARRKEAQRRLSDARNLVKSDEEALARRKEAAARARKEADADKASAVKAAAATTAESAADDARAQLDAARDARDLFDAADSGLLRIITDGDPTELRLDFYASTVFSNLYRDPAKDDGLFAKSKPFLLFETRQKALFIDSKGDLDLWLAAQLQTSAFQPTPAATATPTPTATATASVGAASPPRSAAATDSGLSGVQSIDIELGAEYRLQRMTSDKTALSVVGGVGMATFEAAEPGEGLRAQTADDFLFQGHAGLLVREIAGSWDGTFLELAYRYDPRFKAANRLAARGRIVLSPLSGEGRGLGAFVEGSYNVGRGRDETRLVVGLRLDVLSVLRGIVGGVTTPSPGTP